MNELQIRISADIANLQAALNKAKTSIKSFEESTDKESEKSNVGFRRKIGLIEALTNKAKTLRTALFQATNEKDVERYNKELERTTQEMASLNALGRTLGNASTGAAGGINKLATAQGNANGVAIEFNRIIQDAPFGLIGIGNNLQQLTASFSQVSQSAGGAGAAIKASLGALISPANLLVLGISAVTAGFTAYQMGAFDFLKSTEEATDGVEKYNEQLQKTIDNLSAFEKVSLNAANGIAKESIELDSLFAILKDTNLNQETRVGAYNKLISLYPNLLKGLTQEKALTGDLTKEYNLLTEAIGQKALAAALEGELIESFKKQFDIQKELNSEKKEQIRLEDELLNILIQEERQARIARGLNQDGLALKGQQVKVDRSRSQSLNEQLEKQKDIVRLTERLITAQGSEAEQLKSQLLEVNKQVATLFGFVQSPDPIKPLEETINRTREDLSQLNILLERAALLRREAFFEGVESSISVESGAATTKGIIPQNLAENFQAESDKIKIQVDELANAFTGLGALIGSAFKNPQFGTFIGQFAQFVTKVVAGAFAVSKANAVAGATQSSLFTGPAAAFTLPAFIAGAIGLVASAFAGIKGGIGGGSSGGGGGSSGAPPQIFTNAGASLPSQTRPSGFGGSIDQSNAQGRLYVDLEYDKLRFFLDEGKRRRGQG